MKSQKRHELQTNELADHLGRYMQAIKPYQNLVLLGVVAAVLIVGGVLWFSKQRAAQASASWSDYFVAMGEQRTEALEDVAEFHEGSSAAWWALQSAGDFKLTSGAQKMFEDRDEAEADLKDAEKNYKEVEAGASRTPELVRRARFGLARVYETMCDIPKATEYYKQVAEDQPDSAIGELAERRYNHLTETSVEKWYNWFERQEPAPPAPAGGMDLNPLGDLEDLPERPDLSAPFANPLEGMLTDEGDITAGPELSPADQPVDETDGTEMPAEPSESSATETPADEPAAEPSDDAGAESEPEAEKQPEAPPAEKAPAEETPAEKTPAEEAPVEEAPVEEAPVEEAPVEEAPAEEAPAESDESS